MGLRYYSKSIYKSGYNNSGNLIFVISNDKKLKLFNSNNGKQTLLPYGSNYVLLNETKTHKTNAINVYYHCDVETARDFALLELFSQGFMMKHN